MAKIHFIWWGPLRDYNTCCETVNDVALTCPGHEVNFWCRQEDMAAFKGPNALQQHIIKVRGLRGFRELALQRGDVLEQPFFKNSIEVLQRLDRHNARSAVKDLMSLLVLYLHGGLYLDTTTRLPTPKERIKYHLDRLQNALDDLSAETDPRFPFLELKNGEVWYHQPLLQTTEAIISGRDRYDAPENEDGSPPGSVAVPALDVWAVYTPANHDAFLTMIESYVSRAKRLGLDRSGIATNLDLMGRGRTIGVDIMKDLVTQRGKALRNDLIGSLIVRSVYDGLTVCFSQDELQDLGWQAKKEETPEYKRYYVPKLGIVKQYQNTWRG